MNRITCFLIALLLVSILPGTAGAVQEVRCSASPQIIMQKIIKLKRQGEISKVEMMQQLSLYKHSLPKNEWERLVNQSVGGGRISVPAESEFIAVEAATGAGSISGRVTDGTNGLANVEVTVYSSDYKWISSSYTDATGNYSVDSIPSGTDYKVKFSSNTGYGEEWYNNKDHFCDADSVSVTAQNTTENINAVLEYPETSTISGTVTDESGSPLADIEVRLHDENDSWNYLNSTVTAANGTYQFTDVGAGKYKLKFDAGDTGYSSEWYNNTTFFGSADVVRVNDSENIIGINAALAVGGSISGTVTDISGNPITLYDIEVYDSNEYHIAYYSIDSTTGEYTIVGLPSGQYKLRFSSWFGYASEWYNNRSDFDRADAELISVTPPDTTFNINVVLEEGGSVSGKITDKSNVGIPDIMVWVNIDTEGIAWGYGIPTDANGEYTLTDIFATGGWKIEFDAGWNNTGYASEWHDNKASSATADPVSINAPETTVVNAQLEQQVSGKSISGSVTDGKNPLFGIHVSVYDSNYSWIGSASTNCNGEYTVTGLATGTYKVYFYDANYGLPGEWYNDKANSDSADPVTVTNSTSGTGIDAVLGSEQHSGQQMSLSPVMILLLNK